MQLILILGNQLFPAKQILRQIQDKSSSLVYMREDLELCTHFKYHKHKIILFLSAMRSFAEELRSLGLTVFYDELGADKLKFDQALAQVLKEQKIESAAYFEIEDKFFESRIEKVFKDNSISTEVFASPMFLTSRDQFKTYLDSTKRPFMKTFYEQQRKRLGLLLDAKGNPVGGQWSFDQDNRKPLPKNLVPPSISKTKHSVQTEAVMKLVEEKFSTHPGDSEKFWLPVDRKGALKWLDQFLNQRFRDFGPYEDALSKSSPFVYHSVLTPFLNMGLLTPSEVADRALAHAKENKIPINSCEGFIRQIIGWREFVRGIYQNFSEVQDSKNFWSHKKKLSQHWWQANTGIEPLDDVIKKTIEYGYAHHIERLMVVGSLMLLLEVEPKEAHSWFMEMFIDSSDWVMGPNVYGMALFSDGGIFATKPYICGSNYYRKMGAYKSGDWQDGVDGLYWSFIENNKDFFLKNPRLSMMARSIEKMPKEKKTRIFSAANELKKRLTI